MMYNLRRWLANKIDPDRKEEKIGYSNVISSSKSRDSSGPNLRTPNFNLRIYPGRGGTAIEYYYYDDSKPNGNQEKLYVITDEMNLAEELARIITVEGLQV